MVFPSLRTLPGRSSRPEKGRFGARAVGRFSNRLGGPTPSLEVCTNSMIKTVTFEGKERIEFGNMLSILASERFRPPRNETWPEVYNHCSVILRVDGDLTTR
jgi:hypothetical protein